MRGKTHSVRNEGDAADGGESYFVSMSDMMTGFLFIFIIMLMFFVLRLTIAEARQHTATTQLTSAKKTRTKILRDIEEILLKQGITVHVDEESGILRLKEELLFSKGSAALTPDGIRFIPDIAAAMSAVLPCFAEDKPARCKPSFQGKIKTVLVEGHTDPDPIKEGGQFGDNWELSVFRAIHTYQKLTMASPLLGELHSGNNTILGVSGYGESRPLNANRDENEKKLNRRIDLRFIMESPQRPPVIVELNKAIDVRQQGKKRANDDHKGNN